MTILCRISMLLILLVCSGCLTGQLIKEATTGVPKPDQVEVIDAFGHDNELRLNISGSLAESPPANYTITIRNTWASDSSSEYVTLKRSTLSDGYWTPTADWTGIPVLRRVKSDPHFKSRGCYFAQEVPNSSYLAEFSFYCFDETQKKILQRKVFHLQQERSFPPLHELLFVPLTLPVDVITFPLQVMLLNALKDVH